MTILGKLLAIANVLAAVGFLYLAATDWALRHKWTYAVYRHQLTMDGLPVDEAEIDPADDAPHVAKLSEKTLQDIFKQAGGPPVKTQKDAVQRAQSDFKATIDGLADDKAKRERLASLLLPLARTRGERDELHNRIMDEKKSVAEIKRTPIPCSRSAAHRGRFDGRTGHAARGAAIAILLYTSIRPPKPRPGCKPSSA